MDQAFSTNDHRYFNGWTDQDYDAAVAWATACANYGPPRWHGQSRIYFLRDWQQHVRETEQEAASSAATAKLQAQQEEERRREDAQRAAESQRQKDEWQKAEDRRAQSARALAHCQALASYRLYEAQESIISDQEMKSSAERELAREKKIAQISGSEDLTAEHNAGSRIVSADERAMSDFEIYKSLGGTAPSPQAVRRDLKDPCASKKRDSEEDE